MRKERFLLFLAYAVGALALDACESPDQAGPQSQIVMEGYLVANRSLGRIGLRRVVSPSEVSNGIAISIPISGALLTVSDGSRSVTLIEDTSRIPNVFPPRTNHGSYQLAVGDSLLVRSGIKYEVRAQTMIGTVVAITCVPSQLHLDLVSDTVSYAGPGVIVNARLDSTLGGMLAVAVVDGNEPVNWAYSGTNYLFAATESVTIPWGVLPNLGRSKIVVYGLEPRYLDYIKTRKVGNPTQNFFDTRSLILNGYGIVTSASVDSATVVVR